MKVDFKKWVAAIIEWAEQNPRPMPWKETMDPYQIWLSETILQQTQVAQGTAYYLRFVERFPTVHALAAAPEKEVLHLWQGLGYNTRARNLHAAAKTIVSRHGGVFPSDFHDILALNGVGEYTAAAIASFAFGQPFPVLDSNVIRVLSRVFEITEYPVSRKCREQYSAILHKMIRYAEPAVFNQAMMNFGAMQCRPRKPVCEVCPVVKSCLAWRHDAVDLLPAKKTRKPRRERFLHYFVVRDPRGVILRQRMEKDIWRHMFDVPMIETGSARRPASSVIRSLFNSLHVDATPVKHMVIHQTLTHQQLQCVFYEVRTKRINSSKLPPPYRFELYRNLKTFAFPKAIRTYFSDIALLK